MTEIFVSRYFMVVYAGEAARRDENIRLRDADINWRKRKKLINRACRLARREAAQRFA